jgi:protease-4
VNRHVPTDNQWQNPKLAFPSSIEASNMDPTPPTGGYPQQPIQPQIVYELPRPPQQRGSSMLSRLLMFFLMFIAVSSVLLNLLLITILGINSADAEARVQEKYFSHSRTAEKKVAVFSIEGTILSTDGFFKQQIDHARQDIEDGNLKAIVVRVDSPGGTISGSDDMLYQLNKLAKETKVPIVVSMGGVAASGGYYVSMCVGDRPETIFAEPSTWTGSIGVVIPHFNVAEMITRWGIQDDAVASGPLKTMGSIARQMTPRERKIFQELVDQGFAQFKNAIQEGRPKFKKDPAALDQLATGQVYTAKQALDTGLIDKIGYLDDAVDRAIELSGLTKDNVRVVRYKAEPRISEILFGQSHIQTPFDLASLMNMTTPRGYFLCTWLPALAGTTK